MSGISITPPSVGATVETGEITDGAVTNAKVNAAAAIDYSKLATLATGKILAGNANVPTATTLGGDATIGATGTLTIASSVALAGSPTTTTQAVSDNSTKIATTAYLDTKGPGIELGYAEITSDFSVTTEADVTGLAITVTGNGRPAMLEAWCSHMLATGGLSHLDLFLYEGATQLAYAHETSSAGSFGEQPHAKVHLAAFSGSRTFKARAASSAAGGKVAAGATYPAFIRCVTC